jgi:hypothetical protein
MILAPEQAIFLKIDLGPIDHFEGARILSSMALSITTLSIMTYSIRMNKMQHSV